MHSDVAVLKLKSNGRESAKKKGSFLDYFFFYRSLNLVHPSAVEAVGPGRSQRCVFVLKIHQYTIQIGLNIHCVCLSSRRFRNFTSKFITLQFQIQQSPILLHKSYFTFKYRYQNQVQSSSQKCAKVLNAGIQNKNIL